MTNTDFDDDPFPFEGESDDFRKWFARRIVGRSRQNCTVLMARAALRIGGLAIAFLQASSKIEHPNDIRTRAISTLRCNVTAAAAALADENRFSLIANAAAHAIDSVDPIHKLSDPKYRQPILYLTATIADNQNPEFVLADLAMNAIERAEAKELELFKFRDNFINDLRRLDDTNQNRNVVLSSPPWDSHSLPEPRASSLLYNKDTWSAVHWEVWAQWYGGGEHNGQIFPGVLQGARNGKYLFGLPTARALKLSHDVALIDDALWKGDPAALNAEFKRLVDEARAENIEIAHKAMLDRISDLEQELQTQRELQNRSAVIGHNNPPETIDAFGISETEWTEVKEAIKSLKEQPRQPKDGGESAKSAVQKLKAIVSKGSAYLLTEAGKEIVKQAIKESWPALGQVVGAIFARLKFLIDAALHWLSLLN
jgi:hypothetical protein